MMPTLPQPPERIMRRKWIFPILQNAKATAVSAKLRAHERNARSAHRLLERTQKTSRLDARAAHEQNIYLETSATHDARGNEGKRPSPRVNRKLAATLSPCIWVEELEASKNYATGVTRRGQAALPWEVPFLTTAFAFTRPPQRVSVAKRQK